MNSVLIEFKDGERAVVSGNGLRRAEAWPEGAKRGRTGTGTEAGFGSRREVVEHKLRKCMRAGVRPGLQILWVCLRWTGRFDSDSLPPDITPQRAASLAYL
jgi:hypothetical protein